MNWKERSNLIIEIGKLNELEGAKYTVIKIAE